MDSNRGLPGSAWPGSARLGMYWSHLAAPPGSQEAWYDFGRNPGEPASQAQDTSKVSVLHESGEHFTRNAEMESMAAPYKFGTRAPELEAAIGKVAFYMRVTHISEGKEFLGRFKILDLRAAGRGAC